MFSLHSSRIHRLSLRLALLLGWFLIASAILLLNSAPVVQASPDAEVCGPIVSDTDWIAASSPYTVTCDVQVLSGVTLTIESGAVVKFAEDISLQVDGTLVAQGATFTSIEDTPAKGDWGQILFTASSTDAVLDSGGVYVAGSTIQNSLIEWAGGGPGVEGAIGVSGASPFLYLNTIQNNNAGGIHATGRSAANPIVISGNSVGNNTKAGGGAGIFVSSGRLISNTVSNNVTNFVTGNDGGGIYAANSTLIGNVVSANNSYRFGGGIYESGSTLTNNTVSGNTANNYGGGIYAVGGTLTNNTVGGNTSTWHRGGGVYAQGATLINNTIDGNTAQAGSAYGGGVYALLSTLTGNSISNNVAAATTANAYGGGIYASSTTITGNTISGNTAGAPGIDDTGFGGGIYADGGTVRNNTISSNSATGGQDSLGGGAYGNLVTLQQNTFEGNSANKGGAIYSNRGAVTANTVFTNTTALSGTVYMKQGTATQNTLQGNIATYGGGLYGDQATLTGNTLRDNTANLSGGGIYATGTSTVNGNSVISNTAYSEGGGIYADAGTVSNNTFSGNSVPSYGHGSGAYLAGNVSFTNNSVISNTATGGTAGGISVMGRPLVQYNNLYDNTPYDAEVVGSEPVTGTYNYWGTSPCVAIPDQIYDGNDVPGRGQLLYAPSLYSPLPLVQMIAPTDLITVAGTSSVVLTWSVIPALPDVGCTAGGETPPDASYRVYYDTDDGCAPYDGQGLPLGNSPIDVGQATTLELSGLTGQDFYFVVTAHDYLGRESAYSNAVMVLGSEEGIFLPLVLKLS
jgi:predicted outer membrane repeat protein